MDFSSFINAGGLLLAFFLALISERLVEYFASPLFQRNQWDTFYLMYVGLGVGFVLSLAVGANAFNQEFITSTVCLILTAVTVGGGSNLLHQITQPASKIEAGTLATFSEPLSNESN